jgi:hypothetical protein
LSAAPNWVEASTEAGTDHAHEGHVEGADVTGIQPGLPRVDRPVFD